MNGLPRHLLRGKTDVKDARVIADQARMRRDLHVLPPKMNWPPNYGS
ncbi:IS110 family transposase [Streptomyces afghaniensis]